MLIKTTEETYFTICDLFPANTWGVEH